MPLFGRMEPLSAAARAFDEAAAGRGSAVVVTGEPGIGKSTLARALAAEAESKGARIAFGRAWEVGGAPAFWPWSQALGELGLDLDGLLGSASGALASAQRVVAFDRVIRAACPPDAPPLVLILDDVHAADLASLELALAFARGAARKRALLVVTSRESELRERREHGELVGKIAREGVQVPLSRLAPADTTQWLASVGFSGDPAEVHRLTEGNPLFIEEAMRLGVDRFASAASAGAAVVLSEHLSRLSEPTRELLGSAAVLGREATDADVAYVAQRSIDDVAVAAREGQLAGVLSFGASGTLAFAHLLLRDSLYELLTPSRRARLHARAATRVETKGGALALVARHLLEADAEIERIVHVVCGAAEAEAARHASDSAAEMIATARARLAGKLDETMMLRLDLVEVDAKMSMAPTDEARAVAADCAARAKRLGLAAEQARAALTYGRELLTGRVDRLMVTLLEDALAATQEPALRAQLLARLAAATVPAINDDVMAKGMASAREAIAIARGREDTATLLYTLRWATAAITFFVPPEERLELTTELLALARKEHADVVIADRGAFHVLSLLDVGRPSAARAEAEEFCRLVETLPIPSLRWKATALRGTMAGLAGDREAMHACADELHRLGATSPQALMGWAMFEVASCTGTGDAERLRRFDQEICALFEKSAIATPWSACVHAMLGRHDEARGLLKPLAELIRGLPGVLVQTTAIVLMQDAALAKEHYEPLRKASALGRLFGGAAGIFPIGPVSRVLGELALLIGDHAAARAHFERALEDCREMEAPLFEGVIEASLARCGAKPTLPTAPKVERRITLSRDGDVWVVAADGAMPFRVKHTKGFEYLDHLLKNAGREVYALMLAGAGEAPEDAGEMLDDRAKQEYRARVETLEDQLAEAERLGDLGRSTRARAELEALAEQLASAVGLGGRDRKAASNVERARVNVQRRVKDAIRRIAEHDAALGRYLDASVKTGTFCIYSPL